MSNSLDSVAYREMTSLLEQEVQAIVERAPFSEGDDLDTIKARVLESSNIDSWIRLAVLRPELAETVQNHIVEQFHKYESNKDHFNRFGDEIGIEIPIRYLLSFLWNVTNTNPVPVQVCFTEYLNAFSSRQPLEDLVDITIALPHRVSLFTTILLLERCDCQFDTMRYMLLLVNNLMGVPQIIQECLINSANNGWLMHIDAHYVMQVCKCVKGIDINKIEEHILQKWCLLDIKRFCEVVIRERGPARDFLDICHIMES